MFGVGLLVALAASPLESARQYLNAGRLDEVMFALEGVEFEGPQRGEAATLLGVAAQAAVAKTDDLLALHFAQLALTLDPAQPRALEAAARSSRRQRQLEEAQRYADRLVLTDVRNPAARLLRAELAAEAGEWELALRHLDQAKFSASQLRSVKALRARARQAFAQRRVAERTRSEKRAPPVRSGVVIYTARWCSVCREAKAFLAKRQVDFVERDVERDPGAAAELAHKAAEVGRRPSGVPVIDVRGWLIFGFDRAALEAAL